MAAVRRLREEPVLAVGCPSEMIEMEVREHDVGHIRRLHTRGRQVLHERARPGRIGIRSDPGIDHREAVSTPHEEAAHLEGQQAFLIEELAVLLPLLVGLVEHERRRRLEAPVGDAFDGDRADLHRTDRNRATKEPAAGMPKE